MIMLPIQSVLKACALAMPLLLLPQCTTESSAPTAPVRIGVPSPNCLDVGDPARTFDVLYPLSGPACTGGCTQILLDVQNPCGDWTVKIDGWYDNVYQPVAEAKMTQVFHWDTPGGPHALAKAETEVRLRVTVTDNLGVIGTRDVRLSPLILGQPLPPPRPRTPQEWD